MAISKIMVPYDGSDHAKHALAYAQELAAAMQGVTIEIAHVIPSGIVKSDELGTEGTLDGVPMGMADYAQYADIVKPVLAEARQKVVNSLAGTVEGIGDAIDVKVLVGNSPATALVKYAEESGCDLVVMGRRGVGAIRGMLGSVSQGMLHGTDVPVLTVK